VGNFFGKVSNEIGDTMKDGSKIVKKGFKTSKFEVGPLTFKGNGNMSIAPKLTFGYSNGAITLVGGVGDLRDGFNIGIDGSYTQTYKTKGGNLAEVIENLISEKDAGLKAFRKVIDPLELKKEVERSLVLLLKEAKLNKAKLPDNVDVVVKISVGVGASAGYSPGLWKSTNGYTMVGLSGSVLKIDGGTYYGYKKKKNKNNNNRFYQRVVVMVPNTFVQVTFGGW